VTFTTTLGTIEPREARTNGGQATVRLIAGATSGIAKVSALSGGAAKAEIEVKIGGAAAETVRLIATPSAVPAGGGTATLIAAVSDVNGNRLNGVPVTFTTDAGQLGASTVITDAAGEARNTLTTTRQAKVTAAAGSKTAEVTVGINAAPGITISLTTANPTAGQTTVFALTVTPGASSSIRTVTIDFGDGSTETLGGVSGPITLNHVYSREGTYTVRATAIDVNGEQTTVSTLASVLPRAPVIVTITVSPSTPPAVNDVVTFTATATQTGGGASQILRYEWNFGDGTSSVTTGASTTHIYATAGAKLVTVTVVASDGSRGTGQVTINVRAQAPISLTLTFTPTSPTVNAPVTFTATVGSGSPPILRFDWEFGDGSAQSTTSGSVSHVYTSAGQKSVKVTATGTDGATGAAQIIINVAATPLSVTIAASPTSGTVATVFEFTATALVGGSAPTNVLRYEWDFGDGTTVTTSGNKTSHVYGSIGTKVVTVKVVLSDSTEATARTEVRVN
jgi:PKD repeat protein